MKVMKFGGSSLANAERYINVAELVQTSFIDVPTAAVLSAPKGVTNALSKLCELAAKKENIESLRQDLATKLYTINDDLADVATGYPKQDIAKEIDQQLLWLDEQLNGFSLLGCAPDKVVASILSLGEYVSVSLLQALLVSQNKKVCVVDPSEAVIAEGDYLDSIADIAASKQRFSALSLDTSNIIIMPGFVAANEAGDKVTLGRNGSDYSAAILAACLQADICEIWTDVDGVYNADPNQVDNAVLMDKLTYQEAMELSYFGAKVLHPKTIGPIAQHHIPCRIKNTLNPSAIGTLISHEASDTWTSVKGISQLDDMVMFNLSGPGMKGMVGMASRVFEVMSNGNISISLITQSSSEYSITFCIHDKDADRALRLLSDAFALELQNHLLEPIEVKRNLAIITLVGDGMKQTKGMAARFFNALSQARINNIAIAQGSSERSISTVVQGEKAKKAVRAIHQNFFSNRHSIDVFLIGCGNVGEELLRQICRQQDPLLEKNIRLKVYGIANSKVIMLDADGIDLNNDWKSELLRETSPYGLKKLQQFTEDNSLVNPVIVDCTSNAHIASRYVEMMQAGFHVVTPNKKANTDSLEYYRELQSTALDTNRQYLYETTVGAGLPVIDNLQKLLSAGDTLHRFEGILSGSLSYVFGKMEDGMSLSEATSIARDNGYTEPDPREDLSGLDVARKLLILARESNIHLELSDINVEPVIDKSFAGEDDIDSFMQRLPEKDELFQQQIADAKAQNKVLRYVGTIEGKTCSVKIEAVSKNNALASIRDGENALAIHSEYYQPIPFVIRGYGAGATVTAAGVFADILRTMPWK